MEVVHSLIDFILHIDKHLSQIISQYQSWTYLILFIIIFAETGFVVTPFLPGDSLLFAAGALIAGGATGMDVNLLFIILLVSAVLGNTVNYLLGKFLGDKVFKEENKILKLSYYLKTKAFFDKHGGKAVIFSRFVPIIRTIAPFVAGVGHMPLGRYTLYNVLGGLSWIIIFLYGGYLFGNVPIIQKNFSLVAIVIILVSLLPPIFAYVKSRMTKKEDVNVE
ncbi:DedA family protein [Mucilaginibacter litoreus]|uniref:DedA family protein n=1 Tax=Mucilaginibacter litoreus TaxID=1048221 RepID=A0ABW3ANG0_9SPHI